MPDQDDRLDRTICTEIGNHLRFSEQAVSQCLDQLHDDDIWWRPESGQNSVGNLILHVCGNLRQYFISGAGGAHDDRDRDAEFDEQGPISKQRLGEMLSGVVGESQSVLEGLTESDLTSVRKIQGTERSVLSAINSSAFHFKGHADQIVYITHMRQGKHYRPLR